MILSDIWGASDKPEEPLHPEIVGMDKAWVRHYIDRVIDRGLNHKFIGYSDERIMEILGCGMFALMDLRSLNYMAFTREQARQMSIEADLYQRKGFA